MAIELIEPTLLVLTAVLTFAAAAVGSPLLKKAYMMQIFVPMVPETVPVGVRSLAFGLV
jgi:hypothetical protein